MLGVPGLMGAYRAGNVALANAVGNGVADDKAIYAYVPDVHPLLPAAKTRFCNTVETYLCAKPDDLAYVLDHLPELVVKAVGESGGYGMLMGPASDRKRIEDFRERIQGESAKLHRAAGDSALARSLVRSGRPDASPGATSICGPIASTTARK